MLKRNVILLSVVALAVLGLSVVPARATMYDLTTVGAKVTIPSALGGDALYWEIHAASTGTGLIDSFVRVQADGTEQGYNTDYRPLQFDENSSPTFTRSLLLSNVPIVNIGGKDYREFLLDINQQNSNPLLSLDDVEIFMGSAGNLHNYPTGLGTMVYDLNVSPGDNWIKMDYSLNAGSGSGDMLAYIPNSLFVGGTYVYLYSEFGLQGGAYQTNDGFEEWAVRKGATPPPPVPVPAALLLGMLGLSAAGVKLRKFA